MGLACAEMDVPFSQARLWVITTGPAMGAPSHGCVSVCASHSLRSHLAVPTTPMWVKSRQLLQIHPFSLLQKGRGPPVRPRTLSTPNGQAQVSSGPARPKAATGGHIPNLWNYDRFSLLFSPSWSVCLCPCEFRCDHECSIVSLLHSKAPLPWLRFSTKTYQCDYRRDSWRRGGHWGTRQLFTAKTPICVSW